MGARRWPARKALLSGWWCRGWRGVPGGGDLDVPDPLKASTAAAQSLLCPQGYTLEGSSCTKSVAATAEFESSCPDGYVGDGTWLTDTHNEKCKTVTAWMSWGVTVPGFESINYEHE